MYCVFFSFIFIILFLAANFCVEICCATSNRDPVVNLSFISFTSAWNLKMVEKLILLYCSLLWNLLSLHDLRLYMFTIKLPTLQEISRLPLFMVSSFNFSLYIIYLDP